MASFRFQLNSFNSRLVWFMLLLVTVAAFIQLSISTHFDPCDEKPSNKYGVNQLEIPSCRYKNECKPNIGANFTIKPLRFSPSSNTSQLELQILITYIQDNVEFQIPNLNGDLCDPNNKFGRLESANYSAVNNSYFCDEMHVDLIYLIPVYEFFIPQLMPTGNVNITMKLIGDEDVVSCALVQAEFVNQN